MLHAAEPRRRHGGRNNRLTQIALSSSTNAVSFFIRSHNETLSVIAMCVSNPDCAPFAIQG